MRLNLSADGLRTLAELMLAMVLFTDAANADLDIVRRNIGIAARLLLIGLPLTIVLGFLVPHGSASRDRSARNGAAR